MLNCRVIREAMRLIYVISYIFAIANSAYAQSVSGVAFNVSDIHVNPIIKNKINRDVRMHLDLSTKQPKTIGEPTTVNIDEYLKHFQITKQKLGMDYSPSKIIDGVSYEYRFGKPPNEAANELRLALIKAPERRNVIEKCNNIIGQFNDSVRNMENKFYRYISGKSYSKEFWKLYEDLSKDSPQDLIEAAERYAQARQVYSTQCISNVSLGLTDLQRFKLNELIGFFRSPTATYCSGVRVADNLVLTAAHCFNSIEGHSYRRLDIEASRFHLATNNVGYQFELYCKSSDNGQECAPSFATAKDDNILVRLIPGEGHSIPPFPGLQFDFPVEGEQLVIVGYSTEFAGHDVINAKDYFGTNENYAGCIAKKVAGNCIYHGCQAVGGFSGAPILKRTGEEALVILGIHLGGAGYENGNGECNGMGTEGNVGYTIPSMFQASLLDKGGYTHETIK